MKKNMSRDEILKAIAEQQKVQKRNPPTSAKVAGGLEAHPRTRPVADGRQAAQRKKGRMKMTSPNRQKIERLLKAMDRQQKIERLIEADNEFFADGIKFPEDMYSAVMRGDIPRYCDMTDAKLDECLKELLGEEGE